MDYMRTRKCRVSSPDGRKCHLEAGHEGLHSAPVLGGGADILWGDKERRLQEEDMWHAAHRPI